MSRGTKIVTKLHCKACTKFKEKIESGRNYSEKWVVGAEFVRTSNIRDHAASEQHKHAMLLLKKEQAQSKGESSAAYVPIAQAMDTLSESALKKLRIKFDIAHFVAREKLAFFKYQSLCDLEEHHGVDLGREYRNDKAANQFCYYMAESFAHFVAREKLAFFKYQSLCDLEEHHGVDLGREYRNDKAAKQFCYYMAESKRKDLEKQISKAIFFQFLWTDRRIQAISMRKCFLYFTAMLIVTKNRFTLKFRFSLLNDQTLLRQQDSSSAFNLLLKE